MIIRLVGDVHAKYYAFNGLVKVTEPLKRPIVQLGDFGLGFQYPQYDIPTYGKDVHFIRGNHDNPELCVGHPNYLGDYGYNKELGIFYVGGAWSVDFPMRIEGVSWWRDEELDYRHFLDAMDLYNEVKPDIVISHDAPTEIKRMVRSHHHTETTRTDSALQCMWENHRPKNWFFGHHHVFYSQNVLGTEFQCIPELGWMDFDTEEHSRVDDAHWDGMQKLINSQPFIEAL